MTRRPILLTAMLVALLLPVLVACSGLRGTEDGVQPGGGAIVQVAVDDREGAVDITGTSLQGEPLALADYRGEVVVLNVWGSWCKPCETEAPLLQEVSENVDAQFVGLSFQENSVANALDFEERNGVTYPTIGDQPAGVLALGRFAPVAPPTTYVLDRQGRVAALISGPVTSGSTLEDLVVEVAAEPEPTS